MKKTIASGFLILLVMGFLSVFVARKAFADGIVVFPDDSGQWGYGTESDQQAVISYKNGFQKMALGVKVDEVANGSVWLFPVPASPDKVVIDIAKDFPNIEGWYIKSESENNIESMAKFASIFEIYPLPIAIWDIMTIGGDRFNTDFITGDSVGSAPGYSSDVVTHERIEAEGLVSELITARTADGLYDYLRSKNLNIENGELSVLNKYISQDYSFVVSWLAGENVSTTAKTSETNIKKVTKENANIIVEKLTIEEIKANLEIFFRGEKEKSYVLFETNGGGERYPYLFRKRAEILDKLFVKYGSNLDYLAKDFIKTDAGKEFVEELAIAIKKDPSIAIDFIEKINNCENLDSNFKLEKKNQIESLIKEVNQSFGPELQIKYKDVTRIVAVIMPEN